MGLNITISIWTFLGYKIKNEGATTLSLNWGSPTLTLWRSSPSPCLSFKTIVTQLIIFPRSNPHPLAYLRPSVSWLSLPHVLPLSLKHPTTQLHQNACFFLNALPIWCARWMLCLPSQCHLPRRALLTLQYLCTCSSLLFCCSADYAALGLIVIYLSPSLSFSLCIRRGLYKIEYSQYVNTRSLSNFQLVSKTSTPSQRCCNHN